MTIVLMSFSLVIRLHEFKRSTRLAVMSQHCTVEIARYDRKFYSNIFFSCASCYSLPASCFSVNYDLQKFTCNINLHLLFLLFSFLVNNVFSVSFTLSNTLRLSGFITLINDKKITNLAFINVNKIK